jgi:hypothetical protein
VKILKKEKKSESTKKIENFEKEIEKKNPQFFFPGKDAIKKKLLGIYAEIQANDFSDLEKTEFVAKCEKHRSG